MQNELNICFNCGTAEGHYLEFIGDGYENTPCPECGSGEHTLPMIYLQAATIPEFQEMLSEYAETTPWIPLIDYTFKSLQLPHAIGCDHRTSMATKYAN